MTRSETDLVAHAQVAAHGDVPCGDVSCGDVSRLAGPAEPARPGVVRRLLVGAVTGYQRLISPWLGPRCRFTPSCSEYAQEAILLRGPVVGLLLSVFRLLRCQPLCAGGYDPVPLPRAARRAAARSVSDSLKDSDPTDASDASAEGASPC